MRAILCPGQGAQKPGMLEPWLADDGARGLLNAMSEAADLDLLTLGTRADAEAICPTEVTQPLVVATSLLSARAAGLLLEDGSEAPAPGDDDVVAGHSLGSLTALALAGALTPVEAVGLAAARGRAMARCAARTAGGMVALVGGDREAVLVAVRAAGLTAANVNGSTQVVASGPAAAIEALEVPAGARRLPLAVAGAFHSPLMARAAREVAEAIAALPRRSLLRSLVDDADGALHPAGEDAGGLLDAVPAKVTRPVRWDLVQARLLGTGATSAVELAPAGALAGMARRDLPGVTVTRLRSPEDAAGLAG